LTATGRLLGIGLAMLAMTAAAPTLHGTLGDLALIAVALAQGFLALLATRTALGCPERQGLAIILGLSVAMRLALAFVPPHLSTDAYRYVWDGRVQGQGINPYRHVPEAEALAPLRDAAIYPHINRRDYAVTIYPPAAQIFFAAVNRIADGMTAMKLALVATEGITIAVLLGLLRRLRQPATRVVAYAWHPLAVYEIAGSGHIDAAMVAAMMLGLWVALVLDRRVLAAGILAVAALFKPFAALALPAAWRPWDWRAPAVAVAVAALLYVPYLSVGSGVLGFLPTYVNEEQIDSGDGFWLVAVIEHAFGPLAWARPLYLAAGGALLGALALAVPFGRDQGLAALLRRLCWLVLAFTLLLSPNWPWYYLMLLPFVTLLGAAPAWAATIGCFVLYDEIWADAAIGFIWRDSAFNLVVLGTMGAAFLATLRARRQTLAIDARSAEEPIR
jgi:alpha-1,6-mannosyltransferase